MSELTAIFKTLLVWMGVPQIASDQVLGYEERPCLCKNPACQGTRMMLAQEFHVVRNPNGQLAAEPIPRGKPTLIGGVR